MLGIEPVRELDRRLDLLLAPLPGRFGDLLRDQLVPLAVGLLQQEAEAVSRDCPPPARLDGADAVEADRPPPPEPAASSSDEPRSSPRECG